MDISLNILASSFLGIDCITCTPVLRRELAKIEGIESVKELSLLNKIVISYDEAEIGKALLEEKVIGNISKAGFRDKVIIRDNSAPTSRTAEVNN